MPSARCLMVQKLPFSSCTCKNRGSLLNEDRNLQCLHHGLVMSSFGTRREFEVADHDVEDLIPREISWVSSSN